MGMKWERWVPAAGILFVVAFLIAFFVGGEPPKADEGAAAIRDHYANDGAILTATYFFGIALVLYLSFIGTLTYRVRESGQPRLAAVAFGAGIATAAIEMMAIVLNATLAYRTPADDAVLQALYDVQLLAYTMVSFPAAALLAATALAAAQTRLFPGWFNGLAGIAAIALLVGGGAYAADGFFAPAGAYGLITTFVFMAWALAASALLLTRAREAEAPQAAAAPM
jgi:hypothetical protein